MAIVRARVKAAEELSRDMFCCDDLYQDRLSYAGTGELNVIADEILTLTLCASCKKYSEGRYFARADKPGHAIDVRHFDFDEGPAVKQTEE